MRSRTQRRRKDEWWGTRSKPPHPSSSTGSTSQTQPRRRACLGHSLSPPSAGSLPPFPSLLLLHQQSHPRSAFAKPQPSPLFPGSFPPFSRFPSPVSCHPSRFPLLRNRNPPSDVPFFPPRLQNCILFLHEDSPSPLRKPSSLPGRTLLLLHTRFAFMLLCLLRHLTPASTGAVSFQGRIRTVLCPFCVCHLPITCMKTDTKAHKKHTKSTHSVLVPPLQPLTPQHACVAASLNWFLPPRWVM